MPNYIVQGSDLTSIANAIRTKGSTSEQLAFPTGFVSAIEALPTGGGGGSDVPSGYTQLKYIETSGTQYIVTGVHPTLDTKIQVTGQRLIETGYGSLMGCSSPDIYIPTGNGVRGGTFYAKFGNSGEKSIANPLPQGTFSPPTFSIDKTSAVFSAEGFADTTLLMGATGLGTDDPTTSIYLPGRNSASTPASRIYRAKIWDGGTLVRDFVPALRNADDEIGFYDIVNNVFYTNDGTGVFTGGAY